MKILLLCSSFNGLTQRVWIELRRAGHEVSWQTAVDDGTVRAVGEPGEIIADYRRSCA